VSIRFQLCFPLVFFFCFSCAVSLTRCPLYCTQLPGVPSFSPLFPQSSACIPSLRRTIFPFFDGVGFTCPLRCLGFHPGSFLLHIERHPVGYRASTPLLTSPKDSARFLISGPGLCSLSPAIEAEASVLPVFRCPPISFNPDLSIILLKQENRSVPKRCSWRIAFRLTFPDVFSLILRSWNSVLSYIFYGSEDGF